MHQAHFLVVDSEGRKSSRERPKNHVVGLWDADCQEVDLAEVEAKRLPCLFLDQILQTVAGDSRGLGYIYSGRVISGIGIGAISAVAPAFVSECSPKQVRGRTTGLFQVTIATGVMLSYFINCASLFRRFYSLPLTS